ncbi:MAG: pyrimidine 5'-nucleotidase [Burkholderiaceae bacterium]
MIRRRKRRDPLPEPSRRVWLLDLDNTLHDATRHAFPRINTAMTAYVAELLGLPPGEADALRDHYWHRYGATLLGLVRHHGVDPAHFLRETHRFDDMTRLVARDHRLRAALARLPGRRVVLTNAPAAYAAMVLAALGVAPLIERVVSIESMRFAGRIQPKPSRPMLRRLVASLRTDAAHCVLLDDTPANLHSARAIGIRTVLVTGVGRGATAGPAPRRAGRGRRIDVQVQSVTQLREALRPVQKAP